MPCYGPGRPYPHVLHGFDDKLGGGIPEGHVVLLAGEPGTMKSTIAFNMIYQNALRDGRPGTYISLEQGRENLTRHLDQMSLSPGCREQGQHRGPHLARDLQDVRAEPQAVPQLRYPRRRFAPVLEVISRFENPREDLFQ